MWLRWADLYADVNVSFDGAARPFNREAFSYLMQEQRAGLLGLRRLLWDNCLSDGGTVEGGPHSLKPSLSDPTVDYHKYRQQADEHVLIRMWRHTRPCYLLVFKIMQKPDYQSQQRPLPSGDTNKETANNDGISRGLWLRLHLDKDNADRHNVTYCIHAVDLIQSLLQELLIAALGHQLECRLQEALPVLEQQGGYISDALEGKKAMGGGD